nr:MAG TPA: hypothetical protein [Caudoviricetes sp.]
MQLFSENHLKRRTGRTVRTERTKVKARRSKR